ncbi:unnamed protein product [Coffea canephora]|uniref:SHSP domain-containing protein n=1 Tax=Coffea canephora TaxID=49390 RepID=A0A068VFN4_COFCA|nr:unnamed protein product [Coffea canephora]
MDLELGLKLRRVADEFCLADFQFYKDRTGPVFISTETDSKFFLTAHLKGHRKQNIKIEINEDGTRIIISGEMEIQETVMVEWRLYRKETEIRRFRKAFKIPDGVILDKIKAKYNADECILTISMPKKDKGIRGFDIEEVQEQELAREGSETLEIVPDEVPKQEDEMQAKDQEAEAEHAEGKLEKEEKSQGIEGDMERKHEQPEPLTEVIDQNHHKRDQVDGKESGTQEAEEEEESALVKPPDEVQEDRPSRIEKHRGRCKMCAPILAGSALLLSLVVFVIQFIRKKSHQGKRKE